MSEQDFYPGIRFAITWLHDRAKQMNDPNAKQILDSAAFSLGSAKARGGFVLDDHVTRELATLRARVEELERESNFYRRAQEETSKLLAKEHRAVVTAREALRRLENACNSLAKTRPQAAYDAMIFGGQEPELLELDNARYEARTALDRLTNIMGESE